jgi:hypothetical protein
VEIDKQVVTDTDLEALGSFGSVMNEIPDQLTAVRSTDTLCGAENGCGRLELTGHKPIDVSFGAELAAVQSQVVDSFHWVYIISFWLTVNSYFKDSTISFALSMFRSHWPQEHQWSGFSGR